MLREDRSMCVFHPTIISPTNGMLYVIIASKSSRTLTIPNFREQLKHAPELSIEFEHESQEGRDAMKAAICLLTYQCNHFYITPFYNSFGEITPPSFYETTEDIKIGIQNQAIMFTISFETPIPGAYYFPQMYFDHDTQIECFIGDNELKIENVHRGLEMQVASMYGKRFLGGFHQHRLLFDIPPDFSTKFPDVDFIVSNHMWVNKTSHVIWPIYSNFFDKSYRIVSSVFINIGDVMEYLFDLPRDQMYYIKLQPKKNSNSKFHVIISRIDLRTTTGAKSSAIRIFKNCEFLD